MLGCLYDSVLNTIKDKRVKNFHKNKLWCHSKVTDSKHRSIYCKPLSTRESSETLKDIIVAQPIKTPGDSGLQHLLSTVEISLWDTTFAIKKLKLRILKIDSDLKL